MKTLYLHPQEKSAFDALPEALREGWEIEHEKWGYADTPERMELRLALIRVHDPVVLALRDSTQKAKTVEEVAEAIAGADLTSVDHDDLASLFFGIGPSMIGQLILHELRTVEDDRSVERIAALSTVRHSILQSFASVSHP